MGSFGELRRATSGGDIGQVDDAIDRLVERAEPAELVAAADHLQDERLFASLLRLADRAVERAGPEWAAPLQRRSVRALIELGAPATARVVVHTILRGEVPEPERVELLGALGRIEKDTFVRTGSADALQAAVDAYAEVWRVAPHEVWGGANLVGLRALARRRGLDLAIPSDAPSDAEVLVLAATAPAPRDAWTIAVELELRLARGEQNAAVGLVDQIAGARRSSGFVFASVARQLLDVWGCVPTDAVVAALAEQVVSSGEGEVDLPADAAGFEKVFGSEWPVPIDTYRQGAERACSVGNLLVNGSYPVGTAFVVSGADLHPVLSDRRVLVTNEHVVPAPDREPGVRAEELHVRFDAIAGGDGGPLVLDGMRAVWHAPREDLDVTILLLDGRAIDQVPPLGPAPALPAVRAGAHVYVVGHPGGGGLQLSIRGNDLIDHDGVRIHYKAPTSRGSSGSPVFDDVWRLIGVHHRGSADLPALNGAVGRYQANEGTSLAALREELAARPPAP